MAQQRLEIASAHLYSLQKQQRQGHDGARHNLQVQAQQRGSLLERGALGAYAQRLQRLPAKFSNVLATGQASQRCKVRADALIQHEERHGLV
jgi:hypothetical protein